MVLPVIYHIADIHISNNKERYEEYTLVFEKFYKILEDDKRDKIIVICGDLYDNKITMRTNTLTFVSIFISNLIKYGDLVLIDGNHDVSMLNEFTESTIESMLTLPEKIGLKSIEKIHYLKENKIYNIKGINFGLTTMFSDKVTKIKDKNKNELYISLYHGKVYGCKTDKNYNIKKENVNFNINDFNDYDLVLLGDIHKHQFLDKNKRIAYPSSMIQKDFGENINNHGYILWDLNNLSGEFYHLQNDYCMLNCKLIKNTLQLDEDINLNDFKYIKARIEYSKDEYKDIKIAENKLKKKFNFKEIIMYEKVDLERPNKEIYQSNITENIKKIMDEYVDKSKNNENDKVIMKKIIYSIIDEKKLEKDREIKKIELLKFNFENFFCYGKNNSVNFDKLENIIGIVGDNGWGKSSIVDTLLYTIFKQCARTSGTKVLNKSKKNAKTSLYFKVNDIPYLIFREIILDNKSKNTFRDELTLLKLNFEPTTNIYDKKEINELIKNNKAILLNGSDKKNTQNIINDIFGDFTQLTDNNILSQNGQNFIFKTDKEKKDIIYRVFGIESLDILQQSLNNEINEIKKDITRKENDMTKHDKINQMSLEIENLKEELKFSNECYESISDEINNQIYCEKKLNDLIGNQRDINDLINRILNIDNELKKIDLNIEKSFDELGFESVDDLNDIENYISCLFEKVNKSEEILRNLISTKKDIIKIDNIEHIKKQYSKNIEKINDLEQKLINIENQNIKNVDLEILINDYEKLKKIDNEVKYKEKTLKEYKLENKFLIEHKFNKNCKECCENEKIHKKINYLEKINSLQEFIIDNKNIKEEINNIEKDIEVKREILRINESISNLKKENIGYKKLIQLDENNNEIVEYNKSIEQNIIQNKKKLEKDKLNYQNKLINFNKLKKNLSEKKNFLTELKNLKDIKKSWLTNQDEIIDLKYMITDLNNNIINKKIIEKKIKDIEKNIIIKNTIIDKNNEDVNKINNLHNKMKELKLVFKLFTEDKLIENLLKQIFSNLEKIINNILIDLTDFTLNFEISNNGIIIYKNIDNDQIDARNLSGYEMFISNLAIRVAFSKLNKFVQTDFLIIDEGFGNCSQTNILKFENVFKNIRKYYKWCIIISHIDQIKTNFDKIYNVNKIKDLNESNILM